MVSDLKFFAYKGCKIAAQKICCFFIEFCLTSKIFLVLVLLSISVETCFVSRTRDLKKNVFMDPPKSGDTLYTLLQDLILLKLVNFVSIVCFFKYQILFLLMLRTASAEHRTHTSFFGDIFC